MRTTKKKKLTHTYTDKSEYTFFFQPYAVNRCVKKEAGKKPEKYVKKKKLNISVSPKNEQSALLLTYLNCKQKKKKIKD